MEERVTPGGAAPENVLPEQKFSGADQAAGPASNVSPLVFFGTEDFSATSLKALIQNGFNVALVVTKPDSRRGRGGQLTQPIVKTIATEHNIDVLQPEKLSEITERLQNVHAQHAVLVSYGKILPQKVLDIFPGGIINVHPSLLPRYRGPSPIESAILHGDAETGVTIMQLTADMDAGPIYRQRSYPLTGQETKPELYQALAEFGARLLVETLLDIQSGQLQPATQDDAQASYCSLLKKSDGVLDIEHKKADQLEREVRAYVGFPKSRIQISGQEIIVTKAHVATEQKPGTLTLTCADATYLEITEMIAPSGRTMSGEAFVRGYIKK